MEGFILFLPRAHSQKKRLISFIVWWIPNRPINLQSFKPKECLQKADRGEAGQPTHALKNWSHIIRMKSRPRHRVSAEGWTICVGRMKPYLSLIRQLTVSLRTNNVVKQDIILCGDVFFRQEGAGPGIRRLFRRHTRSAIKVLRKPDVKVMTWNQHKWNVPSNWRWSWNMKEFTVSWYLIELRRDSQCFSDVTHDLKVWQLKRRHHRLKLRLSSTQRSLCENAPLGFKCRLIHYVLINQDWHCLRSVFNLGFFLNKKVLKPCECSHE